MLGSFLMCHLSQESDIMSFGLLLKLNIPTLFHSDCYKRKICHHSVKKRVQKEFPMFTIVDNSPKHTSFDKHISLLQNMSNMDQ